MSKIGTCLGVAIALALSGGCGPSVQPYHGTWKGKDTLGQDMQVELSGDNRITIQIGGRGTMSGTYSIDRSKTPCHFDIQLSDRDEINTIVDVIGNQLTFENINSSDPRPTHFGVAKVVLERQ